MWEKLRVVFTIPELRQKIFLTLLFLGIYRVGFWITLPMVDQSQLQGSGEGVGRTWPISSIRWRCSVPAT